VHRINYNFTALRKDGLAVDVVEAMASHRPYREALGIDRRWPKSSAGALELCRSSRPRLVLMDVALPDANGIELTAQIRAMLPETEVIIVSQHAVAAYVERAHAAGASMNEPYLTQSLLRGDGKLLDWVVGGPPLERTEFTVNVFSAGFRRRNPEGVKAFLRAHLAAVRWINDHPDEARLVLARRLNLSADVARKMNLLHWPVDARTDPALLDRTQQVLLRAGLLQRPVDARTDPALLDRT
jgi:CheY-like chemotaxis protein